MVISVRKYHSRGKEALQLVFCSFPERNTYEHVSHVSQELVDKMLLKVIIVYGSEHN